MVKGYEIIHYLLVGHAADFNFAMAKVESYSRRCFAAEAVKRVCHCYLFRRN